MDAVASYWLTTGNVASTVWTLFYSYRISAPALDALRYSYQIHLTDRGFTLLATINADGPQSHDMRCSQLSLSDTGEVKSLGKGGEIQACR